MQIPTSYRRGPLTFNMTPMIDVVFLLIIFFLVSSHLVKQEAQMPLPLPTAASGPAAVDDQAPRLTVNLLADGRILVAGAPATVDRLEPLLAAARRKSGDDLEVRIRADRAAPYQRVEPILLACARAGVWNVTFAVYRPGTRRRLACGVPPCRQSRASDWTSSSPTTGVVWRSFLNRSPCCWRFFATAAVRFAARCSRGLPACGRRLKQPACSPY